MREPTRYTYDDLSQCQIRLLTVFPGKFGEQILVQLEVFDLMRQSHLHEIRGSETDLPMKEPTSPHALSKDKMDGYEALSYVWGDKILSHKLNCADGTYLEVTESLHLALQYLRYDAGCRRIWADAVCINQGDLGERAAQVAIMASIYECASRVLVWLGEAHEDDALAFAMLYKYVTCLDLAHETADSDFDLDATLQKELKSEPWCPCCGIHFSNLEVRRLSVEGFHAVERLCSRQWFFRTWVYQEAACATSIEVHCGTHFCSWRLIDRFGNTEYNAINPSELEILGICRTTRRRSFDPSALLRLVVILSNTSCEVKQDVIFGIRSIAGLERFLSLTPDYNLQPGEIYRRLVYESLLFEGAGWGGAYRWTSFLNADATAALPLPHVSLFLALPRTSQADTPGTTTLPSWVPAFDHLTECSFSKYYEYSWHLGSSFLDSETSGDINKSKAPRSHQINIDFVDQRPNVLRIRGCRIGHVYDVLEKSTSPLAYDLNYEDLIYLNQNSDNIFHEWATYCKVFVDTYAHFSTKMFKELMYCASLENGLDKHIYEELMKEEPLEVEAASGSTINLDWILRELKESPYEDPWKKLRYYDHFRHLSAVRYEGRKTLLGWIPESARPGDVLCLFVGCPRPFVLRGREDSTFTLLGDAWIHGTSDEMSFSIPESNKQFFTLC